MRSFAFLFILVFVLWPASTLAQSHFSECSHRTGNNATILIPADVSIAIDGTPISEGSELAVFTEDGLCVGAVVWNGEPTGFPIWGDDSQTSEKDGLVEGDSLFYRIWNEDSKTELDGTGVSMVVAFSEAEPYFTAFNSFKVDGIYRLERFVIESSPNDPDDPDDPDDPEDPEEPDEPEEPEDTELPEAPTEVELYSNYPNPFNPSTTIRFGLPEQAEVRITIYNTAGQEIAALLDAPMPAGTHEIRWDAAGLTSGTYFCRLQAGNESRVHAMLLVK